MSLPTGWQTQILSGIGAPVTPNNVANLNAWNVAEGGTIADPDHYNPFNTTRQSGAGTGVATNTVGVLSFSTWTAGLTATVNTILQGNMGAIHAALMADAPFPTFAGAVNSSPWGTHFSTASNVSAYTASEVTHTPPAGSKPTQGGGGSVTEEQVLTAERKAGGTGTGVTLLDALVSPGGAGEIAVRVLESLAGMALLGLALVCVALALTGSSLRPTQLIAGIVPGGKAVGAVLGGGKK